MMRATFVKIAPLRLLVLCSICFLSSMAVAETPREAGVINCDVGKVTTFEGTASKHGKYAAGWTVRVRDRSARPVDWSLWGSDAGRDTFRDKYIDHPNEDPKSPYEFMDCVIDLRRKTAVKLPSAEPYWLGQSHGDLHAYWGPDSELPVFGLIQNQKRFATENLWLIKGADSGMSATDLVKTLEPAVRKLVRTRMPLNPEAYAISFPNSDWDEESTPVFYADSVTIPFTANLPKSSFNRVVGTISVHLPEGGFLKIESETRPDDPFHDDARLSRADGELNMIYETLQKQLDARGRAALKKEQVAWLAKRDDAAGLKEYPIAGSEQDPSEFRRDRNESLLKSTLQRVEALKKRVARQ